MQHSIPQRCLPSAVAGTLILAFAALAFGQVDQSPLPFTTAVHFEHLRIPRPIVVTHAGDQSNRLFIASQYGSIHVIDNDPGVRDSKLFLDIKDQVVYMDKQNEEGLLGFAFHPRYKDNGQFFLYYTTTDAPQTSVVSRFRVSADDPNKADPDFEQEIMRVKQPFWNHNGGTICFGPDGYLYIALGDGGSANDPQMNAQNLTTLLGGILRIDVDRRSPGRKYGIPSDNPFADQLGQKRPLARPEIWAYGLRNVWRMSFDPQTKLMWAGDVGQNLWEEINIISKGGNYGWNFREAKHAFGLNTSRSLGPNDQWIDPIWEYHHDVGKSITGGNVYRGKKLPELEGMYLYADYVSGKFWALKYDQAQGKVVANHSIKNPNNTPIITFGEDEQGEIYFTTATGGGRILSLQRD